MAGATATLSVVSDHLRVLNPVSGFRASSPACNVGWRKEGTEIAATQRTNNPILAVARFAEALLKAELETQADRDRTSNFDAGMFNLELIVPSSYRRVR